MVRTLTGANTFLLGRDAQQAVRNFVAQHGDSGVEKLDGEEADFDRIRESLESLPFLASRKLVVLRSPGANKMFLEKAKDILAVVPETTDVIIIEPKLDKRSSYYKFLRASTDFTEYTDPDEASLIKWLTAEAKEQGGTLAAPDARYLVERVGSGQQLLAQELAKLLSFNPEITRQTIEYLTDPTPSSTVFELLDAALAGNTKRALALYHEQRAMKVDPQQIMALLGWQLHVLAVVKAAGPRDSGAIAKEARLNPFVVRKSQAVAQKLTLTTIKQLVRRTLELDLRIKSQAIDADEAFMHLLLSLG